MSLTDPVVILPSYPFSGKGSWIIEASQCVIAETLTTGFTIEILGGDAPKSVDGAYEPLVPEDVIE